MQIGSRNDQYVIEKKTIMQNIMQPAMQPAMQLGSPNDQYVGCTQPTDSDRARQITPSSQFYQCKLCRKYKLE